MVLNEADDIRLGSEQMDAVYLGDTLVWPLGVIIYVITDAWLVYSSGSYINAGASNYAYALGNVNVYRGTSLVRTMTDVHLDVSVSSADFFVERPSGLSYDVIKGYNLGSTPTGFQKTASVTASYHGSTHTSGSVVQERNYETTTSSTVRVEEAPVIAPREVPLSRYVDLVISRYKTSGSRCPAYGGTATMSYSGGHDEANYSTTDWADWTTYTHTYTSGAVVVDPAVKTAWGQIGPVMVGDPWGVGDTIEPPTLPSWLTLSNGVLTIASEGVEPYYDGRSADITVYNEDASDTETVYQQYNRVEEVNYAYNLSVDIDVSGTIPSSGGTYSVDYVAKRTQSDVYTSGDTDTHTETSVSAEVSGSNCTPDTQFVSGAGSFDIVVDPNLSPVFTRNIGVTISAFGESASDSAVQDYYVEPSVDSAAISAFADFRTGRVSLRLVMTSGTFPGAVVIGGLVYHYTPTGSYERTIPILDEVTVDDPMIGVSISEIPAFSSGSSGEHWFSATSVSEIGIGNTTFPHTTYSIN